MKQFLKFLIFLFTIISFSQQNTEVFLLDLNTQNDEFQLTNFRNISDNEGYDNQPSFMDSNTILYASTRNGQTDILKYNILDGSKEWLSDTEGSEYSPLKVPNQKAVSAIRLDSDGKQLLYRYDLKTGNNSVLMDSLIVGYHNWFQPNIVLTSVLENDLLSLYVTNLNDRRHLKIQQNIGRSLHHIPNSKLMSYVSKENDSLWEIKSIDPISGNTKTITQTLQQTEDMCWTPNGSILMAKDGILYKFNPSKDQNWTKTVTLPEFGLNNITRLAVSPDGKKLAIVGEKIAELPQWPQKKETQLIEVKKSSKTPTIDGIANESIWSETSWHPIDQRWLGEPYTVEDFSGQFKLTWDDNALYVLAEITDDTIFDQYPDPLKLWWDDDCVEVFIDEDNSGGEHQYNHNAFAYHVALDGNVVDMSTKKTGKLYNQHVQSKNVTTGNTTIWEMKISIYNDTFIDDGTNNSVKLTVGKKIGFAIAYCDNDSSLERENFIGSIAVDGDDKNKGWIDANIFGTLKLEK